MAPGSGRVPAGSSACPSPGAVMGSVTVGTAATRRDVSAGRGGRRPRRGAAAGEPSSLGKRYGARNPSLCRDGGVWIVGERALLWEGCAAEGLTLKAEGRSPGPPEKCGSSEFQCQPSACLDLSLVCDGKPDCADGADEGGQCSSSACRQGQCFHACYPSPHGPVSAFCFCAPAAGRRGVGRGGHPQPGCLLPTPGRPRGSCPEPSSHVPVLEAFCRVLSSPFPLSRLLEPCHPAPESPLLRHSR